MISEENGAVGSESKKSGSFAEEVYNPSDYIVSTGQARPNLELPTGGEICVLRGDDSNQRIDDLAALEEDMANLQFFKRQGSAVNWFGFNESTEVTGWLDDQPDVVEESQSRQGLLRTRTSVVPEGLRTKMHRQRAQEGIEDSERLRKAKAPVGTESVVCTRTEGAANAWIEDTFLLNLNDSQFNLVHNWLNLDFDLRYDSQYANYVQAETEREVGYNKGVSDKQIRLKISSPNVLNITLVDLPGITKVPVGDQPSDIEARIRKMMMSYIKQEACIILAVSPANSDLATSDALQMAKEADPTGSRTIGVITKLDIMDRGTNARNFLLGKVVPLRLGYIGVVNRSQEDINKNRSIAEALAYEEQFFQDNPIYNGLSDRCGIPQLAKKLNLILEQHIRTVLPGLKAELNSYLLTVVKELRTYGEAMESKAEQGAILLNILSKYCEAFSAMVDGKSQEMSTKELSGGARIHYIFQSIFVKSLEEVNPCEDFSDEDIRTAIQNATGPRNALFVPEVPFQVLVRRQIARLLDPSLQCLRLVYDELIKMSRACEAMEIRRFPLLRRRLDEVMGKFLRDSVKPAERMIGNIIEIEMAYINSSHPDFIGGKKAMEDAMRELRSSQDDTNVKKVSTSERGQKSQVVQPKSVLTGVLPNQGTHLQSNNDTPISVGNSSTKTWAISSIFGSRASSAESSANRSLDETVFDVERMPSVIQLREPPAILRPSEAQTDNEAVEIIVTKLLLSSYYDIVRKNIQDFVPKAIMHFLVNHTKRDLLNTFIQKLYRESLFEEMLQEQHDVVTKRKRTGEVYHVLQQAVQTLDEVEADVSSRGSSLGAAAAAATSGLPRISGLSSNLYSISNGENRPSYTSTNSAARRVFQFGDRSLPGDSNGGLHRY
ncbi:dynamin-related protein 3A-like [Camellia sinensis]|uniref:dynamin-related protein 3A-like n=1 Tax=Camellia sinensis TaxID=4442 RepID=UPI001035E1C1|nr:dynamin-related protein 3A-like [Camellia sinensis]